jgi:hypothetical protein
MNARKYKVPGSYATRNLPGCHGRKPGSPASLVCSLSAAGLLFPIVRTVWIGFDVQMMPLMIVGSMAVAVLLTFALCLKR